MGLASLFSHLNSATGSQCPLVCPRRAAPERCSFWQGSEGDSAPVTAVRFSFFPEPQQMTLDISSTKGTKITHENRANRLTSRWDKIGTWLPLSMTGNT